VDGVQGLGKLVSFLQGELLADSMTVEIPRYFSLVISTINTKGSLPYGAFKYSSSSLASKYSSPDSESLDYSTRHVVSECPAVNYA
jgi:hypothetical protein